MAPPVVDFKAGVGLLVCVLSYLYVRQRARKLSRLLPPGPSRLPVIGNLLSIPTAFQWITFHKWCQELGSDIIHLDVAGKSIIVLDTITAATELLDKKSSIYSGRPSVPLLTELAGWEFFFPLMPYGELWREHRRLVHQSFNANAALEFHPQELKASRGLLRRLLKDPNDILVQLRHMSGEIIMSITYGIEVQPKDDPYIIAAEAAVESLATGLAPGTFLVNSFPVLKYVPEWMPFVEFQRKAKEWRKSAMAVLFTPYEVVKRNMQSGSVTPSFVSKNLETIDLSGNLEHQESVIRGIAASMYLGGSDTTASTVATCVLGLIKNPDALRKAQEEIDRVVSSGRLPDFDDEPSLPYISALVKEALRWNPVVPLGVPHHLDVEDEYLGYRIPADSIIVANAWAILHDEKVYPEPFEFLPDRFIKNGELDPAIQDPSRVAFGFGRRVCPGRYLGQSSIWITVASLVAVFDISKEIDENGQIAEPTYEYASAMISFPLPFKCTIRPRSLQAEALIKETGDIM